MTIDEWWPMREHTGRHRKTEKKKSSLLATLCIITALAVVLSTGAVSLARYVAERRVEDVAAAAPFYFVSDRLSSDEPLPYTQLAPSTSEDKAEIVFTVKNHIDELRRSEEDILYSCDVKADGQSVPYTVTVDEGTVTDNKITLKGGQGPDQTVTLEVSKNLLGSGPVTVTVTTSSPYEKKISGTFGFAEGDAAGLQTALRGENGALVLEVIRDVAEGQAVKITWPEGLTPDPGSVYLADADTSSRTVRVEGPLQGRFSVNFLKTGPDQSYEKSQFSVTVVQNEQP